MTKSDILNALINHYCKGRKSQFAKKLGISAQGLSTWISRNTFDIGLVYSKCENISADWLITGEGEMFKGVQQAPIAGSLEQQRYTMRSYKESSVQVFANAEKEAPGAIPLVSEKAVGGFANEHFSIQQKDVLGYYIIPQFKHLGVDFMIEVTGDSMVPRLYPGDIIACSIIRNSKFIKWNKPHLISTREQGLIVKRLRKSVEKDCLLAVSDNQAYDPFDIPTDEILGIARVVGVIHLE